MAVNWTNLIIIGAILVVTVFFILPMFGSSKSSGNNGSIGGGLFTMPEGDIGLSGNVNTQIPVNSNTVAPESNSGYLPNDIGTTAFTTPFGASEEPLTLYGQTNKGVSIFTGGLKGHTNVDSSKLPTQYWIYSGNKGTTLVSKIDEGSGKSTTHVQAGGTARNPNDYSKQGGGNYSGSMGGSSKNSGGTWHGNTFSRGKY